MAVRRSGRAPWWVVVVTFVGGVVGGVVLVGLLSSGTPDFVQASRVAAENAPTPSGPAQFPVTSEARVNAACLRVINAAQDVSTILSGADEAAADVDLQRLDDIVRQLQPIEGRLQDDLAACRVEVVPGQPAPSAEPSSEPGQPVPTDGPS